jgi:subtilisin family serine protease
VRGHGTPTHSARPQVGIVSSVPSSSWASYSGTSMATPHVSGAVALYASKYPGATAAQIKAALLASVAPTPSLGRKTVTGGRLDVAAMLRRAPA